MPGKLKQTNKQKRSSSWRDNLSIWQVYEKSYKVSVHQGKASKTTKKITLHKLWQFQENVLVAREVTGKLEYLHSNWGVQNCVASAKKEYKISW